ncbi:toxin-antitoxin system [Lacticaseibacillus casei]|jgi:hypothetical protein|uniref:Uncharacterized protein n=2 Tax=Lacticaseibacillus paracasei TaxID=1597 RepID=A0A829GM69_LACPA|nr:MULTISPECIES: hypothetical protein [Lacticaseibacillus]EPC59512.1 hypothetical protein Lpp123_00135 [Lacticaseibacillus paracasei subsp. paracasei Lpp123]QVI38556.1 toxin-antitoxin system [Lacticaseibacillus casei]RND88402.1 hypothetical protein FAM18172_00425 [Lacticaseibacillus paracasei]WFB42565.1 toxin-antitoxin system [Lacticaseibacillus huelsenbergensis]CAD7482808.1 conserved hypothetical protein [Lacticaseibacillus paracasei]
MTIKSRKQGTSVVLTIPAEFRVQPNMEFVPRQLPDGTIQFVPVTTDKFPDIWNDEPEQIEAFNRSIGMQDDGVSYGRENTDY